jgi:hypothetical protein
LGRKCKKDSFTRLVKGIYLEKRGKLSIFAASINKRYIYEEEIYDINVNELCGLGMSGSKKEAHSQNNQGLDHC